MGKNIVIGIITVYQVTLSPIFKVVFNTTCRYEETCSLYAKRIISEKGVVLGGYLALRRFLSCQPFGTIQK